MLCLKRESWYLSPKSKATVYSLFQSKNSRMINRKRAGDENSFLPSTSSIALWEPLLDQICSIQEEFTGVLVSRIISVLTTEKDLGKEELSLEIVDQTFELCLSRWAYWIVQREHDDDSLRREAITALVLALGPFNVSGKTPSVMLYLSKHPKCGSIFHAERQHFFQHLSRRTRARRACTLLSFLIALFLQK